MTFSAITAKREFTPAIVSLSTSREVDNDLCPLVRDSEPIRLLEMPTSLSLYMLMIVSIYKLGDVGISSNLIGSLSLTNGHCPPPGRWIM